MQGARTTGIAWGIAMACGAVLTACGGGAPPMQCAPVAALPEATSAAIVTQIDGLRRQYGLNAVIVGIERDGTPLYRAAFGESTPGSPATTDLHFRIGGVGWQVLTTVLLRMAAQEPARIALTDRVSRWYPDYPHADRATVHMLAASSAGFGDYITPDAFIAALTANPSRTWTADDLLVYSVAPYQMPQFDQPGQDWQYSHTDFVALGAILEQVSGKSYAALLDEHILGPLHLRDTRLQLDTAPQQPVLHTLQEGDLRDSTYWNPSFVSWAALTSNICDLGAWNRAFGTGSLLPPAWKSAATAPVNVGLGPNVPQAYFALGTLVYPPWTVQRAAYWGMYTTTAYDTTTGTSIAVTLSLGANLPQGAQPSDEIVTAISKVVTPDHPVPR